MDSLWNLPLVVDLSLSPPLHFSLYKTPLHSSPIPTLYSLSLLFWVLSFSLYTFERMDCSSATARRPYFIDKDDGLVSLVDVEAGFSGSQHGHYPAQSFFLRPKPSHGGAHRRGAPPRNLSVSSPRFSARFYDARFEDHYHHFLEACFLCKKPLGDNKDIFMYR